MIIELVVLFFLVYGSYTDLRTYHASPGVVMAIFLSSMFLIQAGTSEPIWILRDAIAVLMLILFVISWATKQLGGADVQIITPLMLTFELIPLMIFLGTMTISAMTIGVISKRKIPYFIPITIAFITATFIF